MVLLSKTDGDSSAASFDPETSFNETRILGLGKQLLKGRMFIGTLLEKYHVEKLNKYRDVVTIAENERQLIRSLQDFIQHIAKFYPEEDRWVGITKPGTVGLPKTYCLWVEIPDGTPLGKYWFKIRSVKFRKNELYVSLKIERKIEDEAPKDNPSTVTNDTINDNIKNIVDFEDITNNLRYFFSNVTSPHNIKEAIVFLSLVVVAGVTGLFELLKFLCYFLIKFMYAWSHFVTASTPILQMIFNFLENMFKVLCTFVAYVIRPRQQAVAQQNVVPQRYLNYDPRIHRPSIEYYPTRQGPIITELN